MLPLSWRAPVSIAVKGFLRPRGASDMLCTGARPRSLVISSRAQVGILPVDAALLGVHSFNPIFHPPNWVDRFKKLPATLLVTWQSLYTTCLTLDLPDLGLLASRTLRARCALRSHGTPKLAEHGGEAWIPAATMTTRHPDGGYYFSF